MIGVATECGREFQGRRGGGEKCLLFGLPYGATDVAPSFGATSRRRRGWIGGTRASARHGVVRILEAGNNWKTEKDTKIEGTNSTIYCKQRSYRFFGLKTNWFLSAKNRKRTRKTAQRSRKNGVRRVGLGNRDSPIAGVRWPPSGSGNRTGFGNQERIDRVIEARGPERPICGEVRCMSYQRTARKFDSRAYIQLVERGTQSARASKLPTQWGK